MVRRSAGWCCSGPYIRSRSYDQGDYLIRRIGRLCKDLVVDVVRGGWLAWLKLGVQVEAQGCGAGAKGGSGVSLLLILQAIDQTNTITMAGSHQTLSMTYHGTGSWLSARKMLQANIDSQLRHSACVVFVRSHCETREQTGNRWQYIASCHYC